MHEVWLITTLGCVGGGRGGGEFFISDTIVDMIFVKLILKLYIIDYVYCVLIQHSECTVSLVVIYNTMTIPIVSVPKSYRFKCLP